jgi:WD40 repeat protein
VSVLCRPALAVLCVVLAGDAVAAEPDPLLLEGTIPLGDVSGRIDHLAVDLHRHRLFVAELGKNSVAVVDLDKGQVLRTLAGFSEPQGLGYVPSTDSLYVASAGDGSVRVLDAQSFTLEATIALGSDADNVRVSADPERVVVGYGDGALALIDPRSRKQVGNIPLRGHPEGFQFVDAGQRALVNVPDNREVAVVDLGRGSQSTSWALTDARSNFPMAVDAQGHRAWVVTRRPARLLALDTATGRPTQALASCEDADDVFFDARRQRVYVVCGAGYLDVWEFRDGHYQPIAHIPTASGARTGLFVPELDRLYIAARATSSRPAAILVYRPPAP